jgi:hypothetical protein
MSVSDYRDRFGNVIENPCGHGTQNTNRGKRTIIAARGFGKRST